MAKVGVPDGFALLVVVVVVDMNRMCGRDSPCAFFIAPRTVMRRKRRLLFSTKEVMGVGRWQRGKQSLRTGARVPSHRTCTAATHANTKQKNGYPSKLGCNITIASLFHKSRGARTHIVTMKGIAAVTNFFKAMTLLSAFQDATANAASTLSHGRRCVMYLTGFVQSPS